MPQDPDVPGPSLRSLAWGAVALLVVFDVSLATLPRMPPDGLEPGFPVRAGLTETVVGKERRLDVTVRNVSHIPRQIDIRVEDGMATLAGYARVLDTVRSVRGLPGIPTRDGLTLRLPEIRPGHTMRTAVMITPAARSLGGNLLVRSDGKTAQTLAW